MFAESTVTTIDLIRHGEPVGGRRFRGSQDDPLSETGWQQMRAAVAPATPWQRIVSSPLLRCREFATELSKKHDLPMHVADDFREVHFGLWEGLTSAEVMQQWPELLDKVWSNSLAHRPPEGEQLTDFHRRVSAIWEETLNKHTGEHLLLVAHGGTIRMIFCHTLGLPLEQMWRFDVQYASLSRLRAWHQPDGGIHYSLVSHASPLRELEK